MRKILVVNAGSSSVKWKLYTQAEEMQDVAEGMADRIFVDGVIETKFSGQTHTRSANLSDHKDAVKEILADLEKYHIVQNKNEIELVGNRVVQGGSVFQRSTKVEDQELVQIKKLSSLAPLHNPGAVKVMEIFRQTLPAAKLSATFDTSFHTSIPKLNYTYPIDKKLCDELKIRKYGFHGTSHRFVTEKLQGILKKDKVTFINAHIGNGASLCAVKESKSLDTSMGLTPLAGIMMGTRSGDVDPSIHKYVMENKHMTIQEFDNVLNKESGVKGVSGVSQDLRDVEKAAAEGNQAAAFAIDLYTSKIADYIALYHNKLGGKIDALVFTAGVGENSSLVREKVVEKLHFTSVKLSPEKNLGSIGDYEVISASESKVRVYVIRTNEELLIAKDAISLNK